jgi:hypothetical protein
MSAGVVLKQIFAAGAWAWTRLRSFSKRSNADGAQSCPDQHAVELPRLEMPCDDGFRGVAQIDRQVLDRGSG